MNKQKLASVLVALAKDLILADEDKFLTADEVELFCPACADKMRNGRIKGIKASVIINAREEKAQWEKLPKGWTEESLKKFWGSLTGDLKHKTSKCIRELQNKVSDPAAFCASLHRKIDPSWTPRG